MKIPNILATRAAAVMVPLALALAGCSGGGSSEEAASPGDWALVLKPDGGEVTIALEIMNVFLVEDESYPEVYEIVGEGATLVGTFPENLHVGYEEAWERLFGTAVLIEPTGGDPRETRFSFVELAPGVKSRVTGGTIVFERISGKMEGVEGDKTLHGRVMLKVDTGLGEETVTGTIAVHVVAWG